MVGQADLRIWVTEWLCSGVSYDYCPQASYSVKGLVGPERFGFEPQQHQTDIPLQGLMVT